MKTAVLDLFDENNVFWNNIQKKIWWIFTTSNFKLENKRKIRKTFLFIFFPMEIALFKAEVQKKPL